MHLKLTGTTLEDVIVVGYGSARSISSVTGAVANVSGDKIANRPVANVMDALQGKIAGLQTFNSSGEPTALSSMRLHGVGSLNTSNQPLIILDGMPVSSSTLLTMNANDYQNVTLLKDAAATAMYGARSANGVLYITSKKGEAGEAKINLGYEYGFSDLARRGYLGLMNSDQLLDFQLEKGFISKALYDDRKAAGINTDWEKYYYKDNAPMRKVDLSISGGSQKTRYYISGNYLKQEGIALASEFDRFTVRTNLDTELNDWASMGVRFTGGADTRNSFPYGSNSLRGALGAYLFEPYWTPYDEDGNVYDLIPGMEMLSNEYVLRMQPSSERNQQVNANVFFEIKPIQGLTLRSQYGIDFRNRRNTSKTFPSYRPAQGIGSRTELNALTFDHTITNTIEYKFDLDDRKHNFTFLAGQEGIEADYNAFDVMVKGMVDDRLMEFSSGVLSLIDRMPAMSTTQYAYLSYFGIGNYNYENKYFLDLSIRSDESSRFGSKNRRATFWSAGGMWNLSKESFMKDVDFVSDLRLRASYGITGNSDIGDYQHLGRVGASTNYGARPGWTIINPGNPDLGWEEQSKLNIGVSTALLKDKINLDVSYYLRKTKNMLMEVPQPYTSGFSSVDDNVGSIENSGIDLTLGVTLFQNHDWNIGFSKTFNYNKNKITELFYGLDEWIIPNTGVAYIKGKPVSFYYAKWLGIDPEDGMQMWEDPKTGKSTKSFNRTDLEQNLSNNPRYAPMQGGFSLNASWKKGISFNADFSYVLDNYMLNNDRFFSENPAIFGEMNQSADVLDEWKKPGDVTKFPKFGQNMQFDSRLIENASFLRMKNITISYSVPRSLLGENNPLKELHFSLTGRNLFTITNYSGLDPEVDSNLSLGRYPNTKQYVASVRASF